ncbi:MAG: hypothetical protein JXR22_10240 [Prolixibacteraceae bacterium]|nr:hypothetical protein [Prolixibacteraceae bacterium]
MRKLEDFMREHRNEFDSMLPPLHGWDQIEAKLDAGKKGKIRRINFWKITASIAAVLVLALISTIMISTGDTHRKYVNVSDPELRELLETEYYYAKEVSFQMKEINKCYEIFPELKNDIQNDLEELNDMYRELEEDLNEDIYNREVIEAMIQNNRLKLETVNRVLNQINC